MKTLYDLLGARPDDDAEGLRIAFRRAVKANHPDHHCGDRGAQIRFQEVVEAYDILRDAEQRASYDRMLEFERLQHRVKLRRAAFGYVYDAVAAAVLASALAGGYALVTHISKASVQEMSGAATSAPAKIAAVQPGTRTDPTKLYELSGEPAGISGTDMPVMVPGITALPAHDGRSVSHTAGRNTEIAKN